MLSWNKNFLLFLETLENNLPMELEKLEKKN